jgi:hypothetical protein
MSVSAQVAVTSAAPPTANDPQAVALLREALTALAGGTSVSDVTLTGSARRIAGSDDETGSATLKATTFGDSRIELTLPSGNRNETRNHSAIPLSDILPKGLPPAMMQATEAAQPAGSWSGPDGLPHGIASHNTSSDPTWFFPALTVSRLISSRSYIFSYVGSENINGQSVFHISMMQQTALLQGAPLGIENLGQRLSQMDLYLDPTTFLPTVLAFYVHPDNDALFDIPIEIHFSNYRLIDGIQVPLTVQRYINNDLVIEFRLDNLTLNSGLAPSAFDIQ